MSKDLEAMAEMVAPQQTILPIDEAEEALALVNFYKMRVVGLRAALRREGEQVAALKAAIEELRAEVKAMLNPAEPIEETE
ncbi:hypothetical protein J2X72_001117 [Phyllobacterium sp. 1468]|uniref:hypothetical protein n=1 Tax=Phyllobacterium sp. 1468 TaxID=2817759 RepID=UPI002864A36D|nr:hypothetical protein [Phyllobacterium sp. 1468]MDR6632333.1 hypothetical protein [Phyllobacterium sp. 1468]